VPFQAWASVKGLFERHEGGWFRTPKTGRITDHVEHLNQRRSLNRWMRPQASKLNSNQVPPTGHGRPRRAFLVICVTAPFLLLTILGIGAATAPSVEASNAYYLHNPSSSFTIDNNPSTNGSPAKFAMNVAGATQTWATTVTYTGQTIPAGTYTFTYWSSGEGGSTVTAALTFGSSADASCTVIVPIVAWTDTLINGSGSSTSASMPAMLLPANSYLCWQITVLAVDKGGLDLRYDSNNQETALTTPTIVVPEHGSPLIGLALLLPFAAGYLIRRPVRASLRIR
jgi:hypothetical protein